MRKTKIVATIGPKTCHYESILDLVETGVNVIRLNMSHGTHEWHGNVIKAVQTINSKAEYSVAVMLDTKGPEVRSGDLKQDIELNPGDHFTFTIDHRHDLPENCTEVSYDGFIEDVDAGDVILVDGGLLSFKVIEKDDKNVVTEVQDGGTLSSRRHLNVRGRSAKLPSITEKDWKDIRFGVEHNVDFIALSFVKDAEAIEELKAFLKAGGHNAQVIAKVESAAAIPNLRAILEVSDGAMVARGDLGAELPVEEVPLIQDEIIRICRELGKPVIVATHLLESMIEYPTPTRAEVADVAQAVNQKADAIMLSGETATGKFPLRSVGVMDTVANRIERSFLEDKHIWVTAAEQAKEDLVLSASIMANNLKAKAIMVFTRSGLMAELTARCRPHAPIFAFTNTTYVRRQLNLYWGVESARISFSKDPEKTIQRAIQYVKTRHELEPGDQVIIVSDILAGDEYVDTIQIRKI